MTDYCVWKYHSKEMRFRRGHAREDTPFQLYDWLISTQKQIWHYVWHQFFNSLPNSLVFGETALRHLLSMKCVFFRQFSLKQKCLLAWGLCPCNVVPQIFLKVEDQNKYTRIWQPKAQLWGIEDHSADLLMQHAQNQFAKIIHKTWHCIQPT